MGTLTFHFVATLIGAIAMGSVALADEWPLIPNKAHPTGVYRQVSITPVVNGRVTLLSVAEATKTFPAVFAEQEFDCRTISYRTLREGRSLEALKAKPKQSEPFYKFEFKTLQFYLLVHACGIPEPKL